MLQNVISRLENLNYTLDMISKELSVSPTQINNYLDSFITIPKIQYYLITILYPEKRKDKKGCLRQNS